MVDPIIREARRTFAIHPWSKPARQAEGRRIVEIIEGLHPSDLHTQGDLWLDALRLFIERDRELALGQQCHPPAA